MTPAQIDRATLLRGIIVTALAVGAWQAAVAPLKARLAATRATLADQQAQTAPGTNATGGASVDGEAAAIAAIDARSAELDHLLARTSDSAAVYHALGRAAARIGVRLERLEPRPLVRVPGKQGQAVAVDVESFGYTIEATAPFAQAATFLGALDTEFGVGRVNSFLLVPVESAADPSLVRLLVETSHHRLTAVPQAAGARP